MIEYVHTMCVQVCAHTILCLCVHLLKMHCWQGVYSMCLQMCSGRLTSILLGVSVVRC